MQGSLLTVVTSGQRHNFMACIKEFEIHHFLFVCFGNAKYLCVHCIRKKIVQNDSKLQPGQFMCSLISTIKIQDKTTCCFKITCLTLNFHFNSPSQQLSARSTYTGQTCFRHWRSKKKTGQVFWSLPFGAVIQASERGIRTGERFSD